jgi:uncharacterized protein
VQEQASLQAYLDERHNITHYLGVHEAMKAGNHMLLKLATAGNPPPDSYALPRDPATWSAVRDRVRDGDGDDVLAADGSSALLMAFLTTPDDRAARSQAGAMQIDVANWAKANPTRVTGEPQTSGLLVAKHTTDTRNMHDLKLWGAVAAAAVSVALLWAVRRPTSLLIAASATATALVWTFGLMAALGVRISFLTVFLAPIVIGIGVDYSVHVLRRYEEQRDGGAAKPEALYVAVRRTGPAVLVAAATTAAGLATLMLVPAPLFAEIGAVAALGILLSLVAALTVVPVLRILLPERRRQKRPERVGTLLAAWASWARRRRLWMWGVVVLVTLGAALLIPQAELASGSAENEFPADDPELRLRQRIEAEYGAFERAFIVVRGDFEDPRALHALRDATAQAATLPGARQASSIASLLEADAATNEGAMDLVKGVLQAGQPEAAQATDEYPRTRAEARAAIDALEADPLWSRLVPFVLDDARDLGVIALQLEPWENQDALVALRASLHAQAASLQSDLGPGYEVAAAGSPVNRAAVLEQTPRDIAIATLGAAAAVGTVLALAWARRGREGLRMAALAVLMVLLAAAWLIAAVPILDATYRALADAGAAQNRAVLSNMFLLAFAVTVAVGVDDLVHLTHRFWEARDRGASRDEALALSFGKAGLAISATSLTSFVGFAALSGVYFLQSKNLAILTALGVAIAYALTLLLAPSFLAGSARRAT